MTERSEKRCFHNGSRQRFGASIQSRTGPVSTMNSRPKNLTLQLMWQERRETNPEGYGYSRFCDLYRRWLKKPDLVLRQTHRAGEKMFVDYAGATIPIHHAESGEV